MEVEITQDDTEQCKAEQEEKMSRIISDITKKTIQNIKTRQMYSVARGMLYQIVCAFTSGILLQHESTVCAWPRARKLEMHPWTLVPRYRCNLHGVFEGAEVPHLSTKHKVTQLRIGKKDDEKHDGEATNIFGALRKREREKNLTTKYNNLEWMIFIIDSNPSTRKSS